MKQTISLLLLALSLLSLSGCAARELTCDGCGRKVTVNADSNMEEDWIIYCGDCNEELFGDDPLLGDQE